DLVGTGGWARTIIHKDIAPELIAAAICRCPVNVCAVCRRSGSEVTVGIIGQTDLIVASRRLKGKRCVGLVSSSRENIAVPIGARAIWVEPEMRIDCGLYQGAPYIPWDIRIEEPSLFQRAAVGPNGNILVIGEGSNIAPLDIKALPGAYVCKFITRCHFIRLLFCLIQLL
ncbi:hypothetical protein, partial [Akkermansia muciniphila]|uniref:hypothetical protein n=1 Tax=Akkermansia muciniphila TaxID=239935 RepID=UPI0013868508